MVAAFNNTLYSQNHLIEVEWPEFSIWVEIRIDPSVPLRGICNPDLPGFRGEPSHKPTDAMLDEITVEIAAIQLRHSTQKEYIAEVAAMLANLPEATYKVWIDRESRAILNAHSLGIISSERMINAGKYLTIIDKLVTFLRSKKGA